MASVLATNFIDGIGRPDPPTPDGLRCRSSAFGELWQDIHAQIGSGWYLNRFLYLFGEGVEKLRPCLDAWSFLVPPNHPDRMILGRNAHGAILVLENGNSPDPSVFVLNPLTLEYWTDPRIGFENLLGRWLPRNEIPFFLDHDLYDAWIAGTGRFLDEDMVLAPKIPLVLGGEMKPENLQTESIISYYETSAPVAEKTLAKLAGGGGKPKRPRRRR